MITIETRVNIEKTRYRIQHWKKPIFYTLAKSVAISTVLTTLLFKHKKVL